MVHAVGPMPRALGQGPVLQAPVDIGPTIAPGVSGPSEHTLPGDFPNDLQSRSADVVCNGDIWIVSTRGSSQRPGGVCKFDYFRLNSDDQPVASNSSEFQGALVPGVPLCILVHGSFVDWRFVISDARSTYRWIRGAAPDKPLHVVVFSWPSQNRYAPISPMIDIAILGRRAELTGQYLAQFITQIPADHPIGIVGHSHGSRTIAAATHMLGGGAIYGWSLRGADQFPHRIRLVFAAAAIDHDWLNPDNRYGRASTRAEAILNLRNRRDIALKFYPLSAPFARKALARYGLSRADRQRWGPLICKFAEYDITKMVGSTHVWPHFTEHAQIAKAMAPYLYYSDSWAAVSDRDTVRVPQSWSTSEIGFPTRVQESGKAAWK